MAVARRRTNWWKMRRSRGNRNKKKGFGEQRMQLKIFRVSPQVAQARLNKSGMRPLGRTQSAPLPLGHPALMGAQVPPTVPGGGAVPLTQQQFDQYVRERQLYEQQQQHNLLKQVKKESKSRTNQG